MTGPYTIADFHSGYENGLTAAGMVELVLDRHRMAGDRGIFIHLAEHTHLIAQAADLPPFDPERFPLWGIPFAVKDNIDVAGMPTTAGCPQYAYTPQKDAVVVARLRAAGAIVVGKTNLDQFATGLVGVRTPYPVPRNAIDPELVPGGSSSGSAVSVARGIVCFALGTDTAGSGRVPAGLNNIVGLKPSLGLVSTGGVVPACRTLDCISIFALSVDDAMAVLRSAQGYDADDPFSRYFDPGGKNSKPDLLTIGVPDAGSRRFFCDRLMERAYEDALELLSAQGHKIVSLDFTPFHEAAALLYDGAWVAERYAAIAPFLQSHAHALHPVTREIIEGAQSLSAVKAFKDRYRLAELKRAAETLMVDMDLLCVPTAPRHVRLNEIAADPIGPNSQLGTYTNFVNLFDMCALAVPFALRADGLPMSVTLIAPSGEDAPLAGLGAWLHSSAKGTLGATGRPVPLPQPVVMQGNGIELVVVGAHLSGMPLNGELIALGGRLVRAVRTAPDYELYALPGTIPPKPGMLRVEAGQGHALEVEVWTLSPQAFGRFVATIPAPLGVGTVRLHDGSAAQGFLVEAIATKGADAIGHLGGWRAYIANRQSVEA